MLALALSVEAGAEPARVHRYTVSIDEPLTTISVRACFDGKPPPYLVSESLDAAAALVEVSVEGTRRHLEPNGAELKLDGLAAGSCVSYRTELARASARHERGSGPYRLPSRPTTRCSSASEPVSGSAQPGPVGF